MEWYVWSRRGILLAVMIGVAYFGWYLWAVVDWCDFSPAAPPEQLGEIVDNPLVKLTKLTVDGIDPQNTEITVAAGEYFVIEGRFRLDGNHWQLDQPGQLPPRERARLLARLPSLVKCCARLDFVCRSWLAPGEKRVMRLQCSVSRDGMDEVRWTTKGRLERPGVYLVRAQAAEQGQMTKIWQLAPPLKHERLLTTFLITVVEQ